MDKAAYMSKKALLYRCDEHNPDPNYAKLETELLDMINKTGIGRLALRPIADETATTRQKMRAESSAITRKLLQDISHEVQNVDNASLTVIVISKCDAIRYALEHASEDAPRGQYDIGRWNDLIPKKQAVPFVRSAKNALSRLSGRVEDSQPMASAQVREFCKVADRKSVV